MSNSYDEEKLDYADGFIPNNPKEETIDDKIEAKTGKKKSSKLEGMGFFVTTILAFLIIAVGILTNALLQIKAQEQLKGEQLEYAKKQIEAYKEVIREFDYLAIYGDGNSEEQEQEQKQEQTSNEIVEQNVVETNTTVNETAENTVANEAAENVANSNTVENNTVSDAAAKLFGE